MHVDNRFPGINQVPLVYSHRGLRLFVLETCGVDQPLSGKLHMPHVPHSGQEISVGYNVSKRSLLTVLPYNSLFPANVPAFTAIAVILPKITRIGIFRAFRVHDRSGDDLRAAHLSLGRSSPVV